MRNFREFKVYQASMSLCVDVYQICQHFPSYERFALSNQIERAAVSIASNIAEGSSRNSDLDFAHFLEISLGSAFEIETQLEIAKSLQYISTDEYDKIYKNLIEIQRGLGKFISILRQQKK